MPSVLHSWNAAAASSCEIQSFEQSFQPIMSSKKSTEIAAVADRFESWEAGLSLRNQPESLTEEG
jgi:hypothetical protein